MNRAIWILAAALVLAGTILSGAALAAEERDRVEEATVIGTDKSPQAGAVPTDTRAIQAESKLQKEEAPSGLKSDAPGVRAKEKMEKPKMAEPEKKKPESKKRWGDMSPWMLILVIAALAAAAG